jgi:hypothetical protein
MQLNAFATAGASAVARKHPKGAHTKSVVPKPVVIPLAEDPNTRVKQFTLKGGTSVREVLTSLERNLERYFPWVLDGVPPGRQGSIEVTFFRVGSRIPNDQLQLEVKRRGLTLLDPLTMLRCIEAGDVPMPLATMWQGGGQRCCLNYVRIIRVEQLFLSPESMHHFEADYWFAGIR